MSKDVTYISLLSFFCIAQTLQLKRLQSLSKDADFFFFFPLNLDTGESITTDYLFFMSFYKNRSLKHLSKQDTVS